MPHIGKRTLKDLLKEAERKHDVSFTHPSAASRHGWAQRMGRTAPETIEAKLKLARAAQAQKRDKKQGQLARFLEKNPLPPKSKVKSLFENFLKAGAGILVVAAISLGSKEVVESFDQEPTHNPMFEEGWSPDNQSDHFNALVQALPMHLQNQYETRAGNIFDEAELSQDLAFHYQEEAIYDLITRQDRPSYVDEESWAVFQAVKSYAQWDFERDGTQRDLRYMAGAVLMAPFYNSEDPASVVLEYAKKAANESSLFALSQLNAPTSSAAGPTMFMPSTLDTIMSEHFEEMPDFVRHRVHYQENLDNAFDPRFDFYASPAMQFELSDNDIARHVSRAYREYRQTRSNLSRADRRAIDAFFTTEAREHHNYAVHMMGAGSYYRFIDALLEDPNGANAAVEIYGTNPQTLFNAAGGNPAFYLESDSPIDLQRHMINARHLQGPYRGQASRTGAFRYFERNHPDWVSRVAWKSPAETMQALVNFSERNASRSFERFMNQERRNNGSRYNIADHIADIDENPVYTTLLAEQQQGYGLLSRGHNNIDYAQMITRFSSRALEGLNRVDAEPSERAIILTRRGFPPA